MGRARRGERVYGRPIGSLIVGFLCAVSGREQETVWRVVGITDGKIRSGNGSLSLGLDFRGSDTTR